MKHLFALLAVLLAVACSAQTLSQAQFTERVVHEMQLQQPSVKISVEDDLELKVINAEGQEATVFLDNAYKEYLLDPDAIQDVITRYSSSSLAANFTDEKVDRTRIVPIIKDRQWIGDMAQSLKDRGATKPPENVYEDFNDELIVVYAEDSPQSIRYLTPDNLTELGLAKSELRPLAVENLKRLLPAIEVHQGPAVSMITADGSYEACLLLLTDLWIGGPLKVDGDIVVSVPSRDLLLVTGSNAPEGIAQLREISAKARAESSYPLTDALFVYRDGRFIRY